MTSDFCVAFWSPLVRNFTQPLLLRPLFQDSSPPQLSVHVMNGSSLMKLRGGSAPPTQSSRWCNPNSLHVICRGLQWGFLSLSRSPPFEASIHAVLWVQGRRECTKKSDLMESTPFEIHFAFCNGLSKACAENMHTSSARTGGYFEKSCVKITDNC